MRELGTIARASLTLPLSIELAVYSRWFTMIDQTRTMLWSAMCTDFESEETHSG
jgi:hypothetical protein